MQEKKYWVLWVSFVDHSDHEGRIERVPIKWCLAKGLDAKAAAAAMLQSTWQEYELFDHWGHVDEDTIIEEEGLLSYSEMETILRRTLPAQATAFAAAVRQLGIRNTAVYVTGREKQHHAEGCHHLTATKRALPLSEAAERYAPCKSCRPPILK
jgi:hypothetical protein